MYFFWLATYLISEDLKRFFSTGIRNFFLSVWCVLFAAIIIGYTAYSIVITYQVDFGWGYRLINVIAPPYVILICLGWVYMHFRYYVPLMENYSVSVITEYNNKDQSAINK
jgi:hypothetical protein